MQDIALLAVAVVQQGDPRRAVRVVLDRSDARRHTRFIPLEVDHPVGALMSAAPEPGSDLPLRVTSSAPGKRLGQGLLRTLPGQIVAGQRGGVATARRGRIVILYSHNALFAPLLVGG